MVACICIGSSLRNMIFYKVRLFGTGSIKPFELSKQTEQYKWLTGETSVNLLMTGISVEMA
ncbi:hypothetical protein D3C86_2047370 [compost metagenome]